MLDRKMGLNGSPRSRKNLKIWEPELFFNPDRLAGSPGPPGPLKISKNQFFYVFFCRNLDEIVIDAVLVFIMIPILGSEPTPNQPRAKKEMSDIDFGYLLQLFSHYC